MATPRESPTKRNRDPVAQVAQVILFPGREVREPELTASGSKRYRRVKAEEARQAGAKKADAAAEPGVVAQADEKKEKEREDSPTKRNRDPELTESGRKRYQAMRDAEAKKADAGAAAATGSEIMALMEENGDAPVDEISGVLARTLAPLAPPILVPPPPDREPTLDTGRAANEATRCSELLRYAYQLARWRRSTRAVT